MPARSHEARSPLRKVKVIAALAIVGAVALPAFLGLLGALTSGALMALPALLLAVVLLTGRYPGERLIERWGRARDRPRRRVELAFAFARPTAAMPRGGGLIGSALAGRAPPAVVAG